MIKILGHVVCVKMQKYYDIDRDDGEDNNRQYAKIQSTASIQQCKVPGCHLSLKVLATQIKSKTERC